MRVTAEEVGRRLRITVGGPDVGMTEAEADEAEAEAVVILVPPVSADVGMRIWALYAGVLFNELESTAEEDAEELVERALGIRLPDTATEAELAAAAEQRTKIEALRWEEGNFVSECALYWNIRGGGKDIVDALIEDGNPKAQELLMKRANLWGVLSRLRMLRSGVLESPTPEPDATPATTTPPGTSSS